MLPYILLVVVVGCLSLLGDTVRTRNSQLLGSSRDLKNIRNRWTYFDGVAALTLIVFAGSRYEVGTDYGRYMNRVRRVDTSDWAKEIDSSPQEAGYTLLLLLIRTVTDYPFAVFWVAAFLTVIPIFHVLIRNSAVPSLSITLYVLFAFAPSLNGLRQGIAVALLFLAWHLFRSRPVISLLIAVINAGIHVSSGLAAVLLYALRNRRASINYVVTATVVAAIVAAMIDGVPFISSAAEVFNPRYGDYFHSGESGLGAYLQIFAHLAAALVAIVFARSEVLRDRSNQQLLVFFFTGLIFMAIGTQAIIIFRMGSYFTIFLLLLCPNLISSSSKTRVLPTFILLAIGVVYYSFDVMSYGGVVPYQTYFSQQLPL